MRALVNRLNKVPEFLDYKNTHKNKPYMNICFRYQTRPLVFNRINFLSKHEYETIHNNNILLWLPSIFIIQLLMPRTANYGNKHHKCFNLFLVYHKYYRWTYTSPNPMYLKEETKQEKQGNMPWYQPKASYCFLTRLPSFP